MLSDDVYRAELAKCFADLERATSALAGAAEIVTAKTPDFVRLSLLPHAAGACPVEIMLRADQYYDISVANEFYEDCRIERFDLFAPLIAAIARGDVIQRRHISAATGTERAIETIVTLSGGVVWRQGHVHTAVAAAIAEPATLRDDRRFLPYLR